MGVGEVKFVHHGYRKGCAECDPAGMHSRGARAFTLVEVMTSAAIVSVLAAIAIPQVRMMDMKAKRAEISTNVDGIVSAEVAYHSANDRWVALAGPGSYHPVWPPPGKKAVTWTASAEFDALGFRPTGKVRGSYQVADWLAPPMVVSGYSNIDGQGAYFGYQWQIVPVSKLYFTNPDQY
jgi:prepilin-type N-terminal cleavage/methylation domain-containing protein